MDSSIITKDFQVVLSRIQTAKRKAYSAVNTILIELYWEIGKYISTKTTQDNWGKGVVKELANFLKEKDPTIKGFGDKNLWLMKQFFETYKEDEKLYTLCREISWSNNRRIMSLQTTQEREFYLLLAIKNNYSYRELDKQINISTFERTMIADKKLGSVLRELPQDVSGVFKDSYIVDFLDLPHNHKEKDLQNALVGSLKALISQYKTKLIPKEILQQKMNELYEQLEKEEN